MNSEKNLFCFGLGYTCDFLIHALQTRGGWRISGTTRDPDKRRLLRGRGIESYLFDDDHLLDDPAFLLKNTTHLLISTPPNDDGDPAFLGHARDILKIPTLEWIGYLSTTGVYGDRDGGWVDETTELRPSSKRGSRRARAEEQWFSLMRTHGIPVHSFRLAGIYGPGRSALDSVRAGVARRIEKQGQAFSRVHVEDIVQVLMASMHAPAGGNAYNVCDDLPAPSHEVIAYACALLDLDPPPLIPYDQADLAPITRSFYADNKRVSNAKIKDVLGVCLRYPDYRAGLESILNQEFPVHPAAQTGND